jgi:WD40 repeat protein
MNIYAQKINPKEYATITYEMIDGKKSFITPVINAEGTVFTPNGEFLFIVNGYDDTNGNVVVYDLAKKSIIKKFKIKKTGIRFFSGKIICNPNNTNQLALVLNKNTIKVIQNWQTSPEDILLQKTNENLISIKAKADKGQISFSKDGKYLFLIENEDKTIKSIDLATGEVSKQTIIDNKTPYIHSSVNTFIGNNEIIVFNDATKSSPRNIEIFDLVSRQVVRKHELKNYLYSGPSYSHLGNPHLVSDVNEITFNLTTGDVDYTFKTIREMVKEIDKDANLIVNQIPGIGFVAAYYIYKFSETTSQTRNGSVTTFKTKSGHGLFFTDNKGNVVYGNFPSINTKVPDTGISNYQISPNGKYIIFNHNGEGFDNDGLVIATLY